MWWWDLNGSDWRKGSSSLQTEVPSGSFRRLVTSGLASSRPKVTCRHYIAVSFLFECQTP